MSLADWGFVLTAPRRLELRHFAPGPLARDWICLRFLYGGLCGSDLSMYEGRKSLSYPRSLGHEFLARVEATGSGVAGIVPGDLVTSDLNYRCGACDMCLAARSHLCRERSREEFTNRGFSSRANVHSRYVTVLPGPPSPHLCLCEPLSCVLHAMTWADPQAGDRTLVVGAGGLGMCLAFSLVLAGVRFQVTDLSSGRLEGLHQACTPTGESIDQPVGEYDVVFDVSGTASGMELACAVVKPGGRVCSMSHLDEDADGSFLLRRLTRRDVSFRFSYLNGEASGMLKARDMLTQHWSDSWDAMIEILPLSSLPTALEARRSSSYNKTILAADG